MKVFVLVAVFYDDWRPLGAYTTYEKAEMAWKAFRETDKHTYKLHDRWIVPMEVDDEAKDCLI